MSDECLYCEKKLDSNEYACCGDNFCEECYWQHLENAVEASYADPDTW